VNCATYSKDNSNILTGSSDGTVKLWDAKTSECLLTFRPGVVAGLPGLREITVHTIILMPNNSEHVFICTKSSQAYLMTAHGQLLRTYSSGKQTGGDFVCATVSPQGNRLM
jgi:WD40 repeat-containing protein SMU1